MNGFAIACLITGVLGMVPLAIVLGIVALVQIARRRQDGKGLAVGGLVASGVWVALLTALAVVAPEAEPAPDEIAAADLSERPDAGSDAEADPPAGDADAGADADTEADTEADTDAGSEPAAGDGIPVEQLELGDCITDLQEHRGIFTVTVVPCSGPHEGQVYGVFELPDGPWPGLDEVVSRTDEQCVDHLGARFPETYDDAAVELIIFHPTIASWIAGDRGTLCLTEYMDGPRTGSLLQDGAA